MSETATHADRARAAKRAEADALGIDAGFINALVEGFYARVRADAVLAPVFASRVDDWTPHLLRMKQFWAAVLRGDGQFEGSPMRLHAAIPQIERPEFLRWLALFDETLGEIERDPAASTLISARARMIADSLLTGIRIQRDNRTDVSAMRGLSHV
ncbi:group III truncated hemoglobin [Sphingomonas sp. SUN039]|uniref:group III truncated hemoglobin n=1 Tax=Sphingomonas sp. SUN039 TaxID=2937787 RepID=UPI0021644432|nr:group III truncated hemoglobin [Sphingomonas sp. SUN039]UVO52895.1 group III truncated hemoglobin [Sphingomonas sp. SUN039]